jgi:hypothetical protein
MRSLCRTVLVVGAFLVASASFASATTSPWVEATQIASSSGRMDVAMDPAGNAIATWWTEAGGIEAATRRAGAPSWRHEQITPGDDIWWWHSLHASVGVDAKGNATVVWVEQEGEGASFRIMLARRPPGGPFGVPNVLVSGIGVFPLVTLEVGVGGHALVLWQHYGQDGANDVEAAIARPGEFFGEPQRVASGVSFQPVKAAVDRDGRMTAVWHAVDEKIYAASAAPGSRFEAARVISGSSEGQRWWPEVAIGANGSAIVAWERSTASGATVLESASRARGGTWRMPELVASDAGAVPVGFHRVAVEAGGNAHAIWIAANPSGEERRILTSVRPADGGWRKPQVLVPSRAAALAGLDLAANASGAAIAVWQSEAGLAAAYLRNGRWGSPVPIWAEPPTAEGTTAYSMPAIDGTGNALVVWPSCCTAEPQPRVLMRAAGYDAAGPRLRLFRVPAAGRVGKPVRFSVSPLDVWSGRTAARWSFGDGGKATGNSVAHSYRRPGMYTITVASSDSHGHTTTATRRVRIR